MSISIGKLLRSLESSSEPMESGGIFSALPAITRAFQKYGDAGINAIKNPLFVGWVYQCLLSQEKVLTEKTGGKNEVIAFTQWFTPEWISEFLIEDAMVMPRSTFIDPAHGAGHLLIPALKRSVSLMEQAGETTERALQIAISECIFGTDIDPFLTDLAAFAVYMGSRDIDRHTVLTQPNLYTIVRNAEIGQTHSNIGALALGVDSLQDSLRLLVLNSEGTLPLNTLPSKFSVVCANPPYMSLRTMPPDLAAFLKDSYFASRYDLYSAFIELTLRLMDSESKASLICQQSFLSISRFEKLRAELNRECAIQTIIQLGPGTFASRAGEKVNSAIISLTKGYPVQPLKFARILHLEEKHVAETNGIRSILQTQEADSGDKITNLSDGKSIAPWCSEFVSELFLKHPQLQDSKNGIVVVNGLFTCNNKLFVKRHVEVDDAERLQYVPYDKGGGQKWYHSTPYVLQWLNDGDNIRNYRATRGQSRSLPGEDFYFQKGITYSYIGTQGFKARLLSDNCVFDIASSSLFPPEELLMYTLGFLNASLVRYLMGLLNPTINFQIGDIRRLPFITPDTDTMLNVTALAEEAVLLSQQVSAAGAGANFLEDAKAREGQIQREIDNQIFALYRIPDSIQKEILSDPWVVRGQDEVFQKTKPARR
ncbi:MAG: N-6 DNA methylase [Leptolyngbya sp.]|nr:N-6 DNA methylase [Candidatus Melainabacteria bacterium]